MHSFSRTRLSLTQLEDRLTPNTYTVTTNSDVPVANRVTLREAIDSANAHNNANNVGGARDVIKFAILPPAAVIVGTEEEPPPPPPPLGPLNEIRLRIPLPTIREGVDITGIGPNGPMVTIRRDPDIQTPFRILTIDMPPSPIIQEVELIHLRLTGGSAVGQGDAGNGGGIWSKGATVKLDNTVVAENVTTGDGGGIWALGMANRGELFTVLHGSRIESNRATNGGGAAVTNIYFRVFDDATIVTQNYASVSGGGIAGYANNFLAPQLIEVKGGRVEANYAEEGDGGGIYVQTIAGPKAALMLRGAKINGNTARGVRDATGALVTGGRGGAIATYGAIVTDDNVCEYKRNREGITVGIAGLFFDGFTLLPGPILGTLEDNTEF